MEKQIDIPRSALNEMKCRNEKCTSTLFWTVIRVLKYPGGILFPKPVIIQETAYICIKCGTENSVDEFEAVRKEESDGK